MMNVFGFEPLQQVLPHLLGNTRHIRNPMVMPQRAIDDSLSNPVAYPFRVASANNVQYWLQPEIDQLLRLRGLALAHLFLKPSHNVYLAQFPRVHKQRNPLQRLRGLAVKFLEYSEGTGTIGSTQPLRRKLTRRRTKGT